MGAGGRDRDDANVDTHLGGVLGSGGRKRWAERVAPPDRASSLSVASLANDGSGSRGVDEPGSRGVDEPGSRGVDEPGSRGVDEPGSRVVDEPGSRGVDGVVVRPPRETVME